MTSCITRQVWGHFCLTEKLLSTAAAAAAAISTHSSAVNADGSLGPYVPSCAMCEVVN